MRFRLSVQERIAIARLSCICYDIMAVILAIIGAVFHVHSLYYGVAWLIGCAVMSLLYAQYLVWKK